MKFKYYAAFALATFMFACKKQADTSAEEPKKKEPPVNITGGHPPDDSYEIMFTDQFSANNIGSSGEGFWNPREGAKELFYGLTAYNRAANNSVNNGILAIKFDQDPDGKYYGGGILSKKTFGYGYYEAKVKLYTGSYGLHQSFWSFTTAIEIDGFETDSKLRIESSPLHPGLIRWKPYNTLYQVNETEKSKYVYVPNTNLSSPAVNEDGIWTDSDGVWFIVGYEWLPDRVNYYVNNVLKNSFPLIDTYGNDLNVFQPSNVWLTAIPYKASSVLDMVAPQPGAKMQVDYFNYYAKRLPNANLLGNSQFSYVSNDLATKESTVTAWTTSPLIVNGSILYGNSAVDATNSYVIKDGSNWYLEQKNDTKAYKAESYQTLNYLLPGTYKFTADVRCSGAGSKLIVLAKDKTTVLYSKTIVNQSSWMNISSDDVPITSNEATILIYSDAIKGDWLQVDNVKFTLKQ